MEKDFDRWNENKKAINMGDPPKFYCQREIWWCALGINIGDEQDGTGNNFDRPVIVVKRFNARIFFGVALTGSGRKDRYHFPLGIINGRRASAILSQVRLIDTRRLVRKMATLDEGLFEDLKSALQRTLFG
jgi:mRNA interferase MazF